MMYNATALPQRRKGHAKETQRTPRLVLNFFAVMVGFEVCAQGFLVFQSACH